MGYFGKNFKRDEDEDGEEKVSQFLKAKDFEGGLEAQFVGMEKEVANNPKFGAGTDDYLLKEGMLGKGELFTYKFITSQGEKTYSTKSASFFIGMKNADPEIDDVLIITKTGEGFDTRYEAKIK